MFTGLIAEVGKVARLTGRGREALLEVACSGVLEGARKGDSIAVDGACVTVESLSGGGFSAFLSSETLERTTLGDLRPGGAVNLEAALRPGDRMGGHLVQGHVEGVGRVRTLAPVGQGWRLQVELPDELLKYVVPKGSIALSGISLTVAKLEGRWVEAAVIPATLKATTMSSWSEGTKINVETDLVGRYIVAYLERLRPGRGLAIDDLTEKGF
jgi:riboflavin synthase